MLLPSLLNWSKNEACPCWQLLWVRFETVENQIALNKESMNAVKGGNWYYYYRTKVPSKRIGVYSLLYCIQGFGGSN